MQSSDRLPVPVSDSRMESSNERYSLRQIQIGRIATALLSIVLFYLGIRSLIDGGRDGNVVYVMSGAILAIAAIGLFVVIVHWLILRLRINQNRDDPA